MSSKFSTLKGSVFMMLSVALLTFSVVGIAEAATIIGSDINTEGTLDVTGATTLSDTLGVTGITTLSSLLNADAGIARGH